jgi:putative ABC transport system permease protein
VLEIVGVVGDLRGRPITDEPESWIYRPAAKPSWGIVHVRSGLPLAETATVIRGVARGIDANLPPYDLEPLGASVERVLAEQRLLARLSTVFAAVAALLAAIGIYGMMACAVGERMREFGIRMALGARAATLLRLVLRSALTVTAAGLAAGIGAALLASRVLESRLYGVSGQDPMTVGAACGILLTLSILASALPALRATRADPVASLRVE